MLLLPAVRILHGQFSGDSLPFDSFHSFDEPVLIHGVSIWQLGVLHSTTRKMIMHEFHSGVAEHLFQCGNHCVEDVFRLGNLF